MNAKYAINHQMATLVISFIITCEFYNMLLQSRNYSDDNGLYGAHYISTYTVKIFNIALLHHILSFFLNFLSHVVNDFWKETSKREVFF